MRKTSANNVVSVLQDQKILMNTSKLSMKEEKIMNVHIVADILVKEFGFIDTSK